MQAFASHPRAIAQADVGDKYSNWANGNNNNNNNHNKKKKKKNAKKIPLCLVLPASNDDTAADGDILARYYKSRLPQEEDLGLQEDEFPALSKEQKQSVKLTADTLIECAFNCLTTKSVSRHLLIRCKVILSLQAGGNPESAFRDKLNVHGVIEDMKVFPRQCCVAASFATVNSSVNAVQALQGSEFYCHKMTCSYLTKYPNKEVILSCRNSVATNAGVAASTAARARPPVEPLKADATEYEEADELIAYLLGG